MPIGMILEALVAVLLVVTVVYCAILDRRLKALRSGQDGLKAIVEALDGATRRAQTSIGELRAAAEATGLALSAHTAKGRALCDELQIMAEAGNALADRLAAARHPPVRLTLHRSRKPRGRRFPRIGKTT